MPSLAICRYWSDPPSSSNTKSSPTLCSFGNLWYTFLSINCLNESFGFDSSSWIESWQLYFVWLLFGVFKIRSLNVKIYISGTSWKVESEPTFPRGSNRLGVSGSCPAQTEPVLCIFSSLYNSSLSYTFSSYFTCRL